MPVQRRKHQEEEETDEKQETKEEEEIGIDQMVISDGEDENDNEGSNVNDINERLKGIRKNLECPICLGFLRETRTAVDCLHRFCKECIEKSLRMGKNECPTCRKHFPSRRSFMEDPRYDAIVACILPNFDESKELELSEEEKTRNKTVQESINKIAHLQAEAHGKKVNDTPSSSRRGRKPKNETTNIHEQTREAKQNSRRLAIRSSAEPPSTPLGIHSSSNADNISETNLEAGSSAHPESQRTPESFTWAVSKARSKRDVKPREAPGE